MFADTSRAPRGDESNGRQYYFVPLSQMLKEVAQNQYLEFGTHENAMYGTKLSTVRNLIASGHVPVLDVEPQALKILRCREFAPFVVFVAPPVDLEVIAKSMTYFFLIYCV